VTHERAPNSDTGGKTVVKRTESNATFVPVILLHDADTGKRVCVNGMWFTTFTESGRGTTFNFTNGKSVTVDESFDEVASAFERSASR
jgi:hypothetical protein